MHSVLRQPINRFGSMWGISPADSEIRAVEGLWADPSLVSKSYYNKEIQMCGF